MNSKTARLYADNAREKPWAEAVAWSARAAMAGGLATTQPVSVSIMVRQIRPRRSRLNHPLGDVDKLARSVLDAMTGVVYRDDSLVVELGVGKRWCAGDEQPGAAIVVSRVSP